MPVYPSLEWVQELADKLNANEEYAKAAADMEADFLLAVEEDDLLDKSVYLYINLVRGKITEVAEFKSADEKEAAFVLAAEYSVWKDIIKQETNTMECIMRGKMKMKGDMSMIMKQPQAQSILAETMTQVETKFIDEV